MGFFKRAKQLWNKVKSGAKKVVQKIIKHAPGAINALIKVIEIADGLKIRKLVLNAIPGVGGYINQVVDLILECKQKGVFDKIIDLLKQLLEGQIQPEKFIELVKSIIASVSDALSNTKLKGPVSKNLSLKTTEASPPRRILKEKLNKLKETKELIPEEKTTEENTLEAEENEEPSNPVSVFGQPVN